MFAAAYLYKKYKNKKSAPFEHRRLSSESNISPDNDLQEVRVTNGIQRAGTVVDVVDKKMQRKQWIMLGVGMFIDLVLPIILYYSLKSHISTLAALLISSAPPAIWVVVKYFIFRRVDPLGLLIIFGFIVSGVVSAIDGNPRLLLLRDSFVTAATGVLFLGSLIPLKIKKFELKPLTYGVSAQMTAAAPKVRYLIDGKVIEQARSEFCWQWSHKFRNGMRLTTAIWGIALLVEFAIKVVMYFSTLTVDQMVLYGNVVLGVTLGTAGAATLIASHYIRKSTVKEVQVIKARLERENDEWEATHLPQQQHNSGETTQLLQKQYDPNESIQLLQQQREPSEIPHVYQQQNTPGEAPQFYQQQQQNNHGETPQFYQQQQQNNRGEAPQFYQQQQQQQQRSPGEAPHFYQQQNDHGNAI
ncbi:hypothetical protein BGZ46_007003 [Entomortierella lignicola]|nr:hypothetical protein BGZ46_007003 [Entomortierella lignicola]